ncbi:MAG TPA: 30S ribosomal protein S8 [Elusimicrobiales bacterium]|nr:30S ribosomal protein S8 [Elusimicrobiales bacterium]
MDPIADLLTRIRNAVMKNKERVDIPFSKLKSEIVKVLKEEGYIVNFKPVHVESKDGVIRVFLKYTDSKNSVISGLKRVSRPGKRIYRPYDEIPKVRGPFGISILSTSHGLMTDEQAKAKKVGGEVLCQVW